VDSLVPVISAAVGGTLAIVPAYLSQVTAGFRRATFRLASDPTPISSKRPRRNPNAQVSFPVADSSTMRPPPTTVQNATCEQLRARVLWSALHICKSLKLLKVAINQRLHDIRDAAFLNPDTIGRGKQIDSLA
jgi:hypothetical protein